MLEEIRTIVKTCDNLSAVKCLCLCLYLPCRDARCRAHRSIGNASPSKLVVPWCFIAGFLPSSFALHWWCSNGTRENRRLWTNCRFHLTSRAFRSRGGCIMLSHVNAHTLMRCEHCAVAKFNKWSMISFSHVEMTMCKSDQVNHFVQMSRRLSVLETGLAY